MEKTLGEITGGGVRVDRDEPWLFGVDVGRPIVEDFRDWPLEVERDEARRHDRNTSRLMNSLDLSIDPNLGDLIRVKRLGGCWLGFLLFFNNNRAERALRAIEERTDDRYIAEVRIRERWMYLVFGSLYSTEMIAATYQKRP